MKIQLMDDLVEYDKYLFEHDYSITGKFRLLVIRSFIRILLHLGYS